MNFQDLLNDLYDKLNCTQNKLTIASGLSAPVISRYLSGERTPTINSDQLRALARGLSDIAMELGMDSPEYDYDSLLTQLTDSLLLNDLQYEIFLENFNNLIDFFDIKIKDLAKGINFDASFLYRIRSGKRHPASLNSFCNLVAFYIADNFYSEKNKKDIACFLNCNPEELSTRNSYAQQILKFFSESLHSCDPKINVSNFLNKMDEFNLDEYIEAIHFNDIKIPTTPIHLPISKYYYGIEDMRKAELDFFKTTVLSKSTEPVFMCGDMPMTDMAEDMDFNKKWMFAIAATLKKGLHINIIHNLDRPFEEIILGLEAWIPIYMTGQVHPYHLEDYQNDVFHQLNYCSGSAALFGECIENYHNEGRYFLSTNKHDISYYRKKADALLKHAKPLMDIYTALNAKEYMHFLNKSMYKADTDRRVIASTPPLYTLPENILQQTISSLTDDLQHKILDYYQMLKAATTKLLKNNQIVYEYHILSENEFNEHPLSLSFPELFIPPVREYTYEEYLAHINATIAYQKQNDNFIFDSTSQAAFKNIQITVLEDYYFVVSKYNSPNIHFVIRHPAMLSGMKHFYAIKKE